MKTIQVSKEQLEDIWRKAKWGSRDGDTIRVFSESDEEICYKVATAPAVTRSAAPSGLRRDELTSDRLLREYREVTASEHPSAPEPSAPAPAPVEETDEPKPAAKAGHARIADRLDGKSAPLPRLQTRDSRIATQRAVQTARSHVFELPAPTAAKAEPSARIQAQRADDRARSVGRIGKTPTSIASRLDPKGAA